MEKGKIWLFMVLVLGGMLGVGCEFSRDYQPDVVEYDYEDSSVGVEDDHGLDPPDVVEDSEVLSLEDVCLPFVGTWKCFYEVDGSYYDTRIITLIGVGVDGYVSYTQESLEQGGVYMQYCTLETGGMVENGTICTIESVGKMHCIVTDLWDPNKKWAYNCDKL